MCKWLYSKTEFSVAGVQSCLLKIHDLQQTISFTHLCGKTQLCSFFSVAQNMFFLSQVCVCDPKKEEPAKRSFYLFIRLDAISGTLSQKNEEVRFKLISIIVCNSVLKRILQVSKVHHLPECFCIFFFFFFCSWRPVGWCGVEFCEEFYQCDWRER